ncbi:hypothetical protein WJX72_006817 [[Myrmecia] bisecta]|uniref:Metallo-beta-lactamase domain-containing protein n=1 Tax=[Myrmecia] bisecta TaxID=41462 RepID=A0AAW1R7Q3_9CHLO
MLQPALLPPLTLARSCLSVLCRGCFQGGLASQPFSSMAPPEDLPVRPAHHRAHKTFRDGLYDNPWATWEDRGFSEVRKWWSEQKAKQLPSSGWLRDVPRPKPADFAAAFPLQQIDYAALNNPPRDAIQAIWVGHATVLVQMEGCTFLTDPIFSARCSPVQFAGPKRVVPAPLDVDHSQLPKIDFVVISHNHYDHLDHGSVMRLHKRFGSSMAWYVPLGLEAWFSSCGIRNVTAMDWWEEVQHPGSSVKVVSTPAQHWSSRKGYDRKATLWGGWAVCGEQQRFWFAGDTGYCPVFTDIGKRYGPFDLAAIPIGAYEPRWFMRPQHVDPAEAVQIHQDVKSRRSIGIHCCTFNLTDEAMDEPPSLLLEKAASAGLPANAFTTLKHGALLQTVGGVDRNSPPTLGTQASNGVTPLNAATLSSRE